MMRRFTRYLLWEIGKIFAVSLVAFTSIIMLGGIVQRLITTGIGPQVIFELIPYILPMGLQFALPATLLFAVASVYGRIAADNEIVAVKAAGVPPIRVIAPTLILGFLFSPVAVWLNDLAASWGLAGINQVIMQQSEEVVYRHLKMEGSYSDRNFSIHVQAVEGKDLIHPTITFHSSSGKPLTICAQSAQLRFNPENETLKILLVDSEVDQGDSFIGHLPGLNSREIPLNNTPSGPGTARPSSIALRQIAEETNHQTEKLRQLEELISAHTLMGLSAGRYDWLGSAKMAELSSQLTLGTERLNKLRTEPWRRWANGFSCFFFVWMGVPLAIWWRTADYWTSFGICFLPILLIYYPLFMLGAEQAKDGNLPPYSVWLGNFALLLIGAWFLRKVNRW
ncbi:MAG: LptF/LptG family permease [Pirellulales bacterium]